MIDITLLGTSALLPIPGRALTSVLLQCDGHRILFDCGEGTQTAARQCGVSLMKTDLIALTHYHGDHIFGLPGLLQTMGSMGRTQVLYITGPQGLQEAMQPILQMTGWVNFPVVLLDFSMKNTRLCEKINGWNYDAYLQPFPTEHRTVSCGYAFALHRPGRFLPEKAKALAVPVRQWSLLQKGECVSVDGTVLTPSQVLSEPRAGLKVVFSGDTSPCQSLEQVSSGADLLITDATYAEDIQSDIALEYGHMTFRMAAETAKKANVKRLWLSHYSQQIDTPEAYLPDITGIFPDTECGFDGKTIRLRYTE